MSEDPRVPHQFTLWCNAGALQVDSLSVLRFSSSDSLSCSQNCKMTDRLILNTKPHKEFPRLRLPQLRKREPSSSHCPLRHWVIAAGVV